jgi:small subunit ribosomal protein S6
MRTYEAMCVFRVEEDTFQRGKEAVRQELEKLGANIAKEEDMGQRTLAYPINDQNQAHYFYFVAEMDPDKAHQVEDSVRLFDELLRFMMVRQDN